jgi:hypothetical protein
MKVLLTWVVVNGTIDGYNHQTISSSLKGKKREIMQIVVNVSFYLSLSHQFRQFIAIQIFVHIAQLYCLVHIVSFGLHNECKCFIGLLGR